MKLRITKDKPRSEGGYGETRAALLNLDELSLQQLAEKGCAFKCAAGHRPYISTLAKDNGIAYLTVPCGKGNMYVIRLPDKFREFGKRGRKQQ